MFLPQRLPRAAAGLKGLRALTRWAIAGGEKTYALLGELRLFHVEVVAQEQHNYQYSNATRCANRERIILADEWDVA
jgi:hypothetical protein